MSRLVPLAFAGAGAATVCVGSVYLWKNGIGGSTGVQNALSAAPALNATLGFKDLSGFKTNKGGECTARYFGNSLDFQSAKGETIGVSSKVADDYFTNSSSASGPESCLIVNWEKTNGTAATNNKWLGGFRWLWSFKNGNRGFVMFSSVKPSSTASTLDLEGGIYFVENEVASGSSNWTIKKNREVTQTINTTNTLDNFFPKTGSTLKSGIQDGVSASVNDYWGFVSGQGDLSNACVSGGSETCPAQSEQTSTKAWVWFFSPKEGADGKVGDWSENFNDWSNNLFKEGESNLKKILETFKGSWEKQTTTGTGG